MVSESSVRCRKETVLLSSPAPGENVISEVSCTNANWQAVLSLFVLPPRRPRRSAHLGTSIERKTSADCATQISVWGFTFCSSLPNVHRFEEAASQGSAERRSTGPVNFVPADAYHFCLGWACIHATCSKPAQVYSKPPT